jgi:uncharacterized membrane protein SpoIIM required for sporulation
MTECNDIKEQRRHNTGLAKVAVQSSADTFVVNQSWFSASTFVVKIATFAKPETVSGYLLTLQKSEKLSCNILNINSSYFFNNIKL